MAGALVLMALFLLFAIGVGVGFLIGRATA
jgi:phosphotransferase system  glucose/maltose/N-acetylglucosamine-specific IIC component